MSSQPLSIAGESPEGSEYALRLSDDGAGIVQPEELPIPRGLEQRGRRGQLVEILGRVLAQDDVHRLPVGRRDAVVHGDVFRDIRPAMTIVKVDFIDPKILVEIEAEAVYGGADEKSNSNATVKR